MSESINREFGPQTWVSNPEYSHKNIFWDEYHGHVFGRTFSFWDINSYPKLTHPPTFQIKVPTQVDYSASNQKFLVGASKNGTIGIYQKDGSLTKNKILRNPKDRISKIQLHHEYLLVTVDTYVGSGIEDRKTYIFNLEKEILNGSFEMDEDDGPYLTDKYAISWNEDMDPPMTIIDLDSLEEFPITREFEEIIYTMSEVPIFMSLGEELVGYHAPTGELAWKFPEPILCVYDLKTNNFAARSEDTNKVWIVDGITGEIIDAFEDLDFIHISPIHTPTRTKYILH